MTNTDNDPNRTATRAAQRPSRTIDANPLAVLAGGLAVGALAGALLPRSEREKELLAPLGKELGTRARAATEAAKNAGKSELEELGLTKGAAKDQVKSVFQGVAKAIGNAGTAAAKQATAKP